MWDLCNLFHIDNESSGYWLGVIVEHEGRNCAIPGRFKIFPLLRLNFSLRENSKHITSVDIAIAERGNRSGYPERSGK